MIEAPDNESEEEYDSREDAHYEVEVDVGASYADDDEEEDESIPSDEPIPGGRDVRGLPLYQWTKPEYWTFRQENPYVAATGQGIDPRFKNEYQHRVYYELLMTKGKKFAPHKQVNVEHLRDNSHIYPTVYDALGRLGLISFVSFGHPFNEDLVMQFFAMVYFENDDECTLRWMSGTRECSASMAQFSKIIPYQFF